MRILTKSEKNELTIFDSVSESKITMFYRLPTYPERVRYSNGLYRRNGEAIYIRPETRINEGIKIITGFEEGAFADQDGKEISSDPESKNYREDWKELLKEFAPEIVAAVALHVYESSQIDKKELSEVFKGLEIKIEGGNGYEDPFVEKS